ncbi:hypothetical protein DN824_20475 [Stutzerimonas nosocomialis]|uniref:hypothetical protein n=1 Tax=Stutzerimonas nosocomialis TaxID=1056496 RepID=UPI0011098501|nr:hypothetical protein [Stutzerimonas nosocomialis]TLX54861.1 hypothetical protein DN824_20475 [Stutzerimonas nosocomialis]
MIDLPSGLDEIVAYGWPWHGLIRREGATQEVTLANGRSFRCDHGGSYTYLFDSGKEDIQSDAIEALGGAWWGKAILRGGNLAGTQLTWGGGLRTRLNNSTSEFFGMPLLMAGAETPWFVRYTLENLTLTLSLRIGVDEYAFAVPVSLSDLGQGAGQPSYYALQSTAVSNPQRFLVNDAFPGSHQLELLDFRQNRMLLGVVVIADSRAPAYTEVYSENPPATVNGRWPRFYSGLIEVEIGPDLLDVEDAADAVTIRVIEDRASALGAPVREQHDGPGGIIRDYLERWTQTSGLVTAWYEGDTVRTARFDRVQECTLRRWIQTDEQQQTVIEQQTRTRSTQLRLLNDSGVVIDQIEMTEILEEIQTNGSQLQVRRTVQVSGQPDDVTESSVFTGTASFGGPFTCFPPGLHGVNTCVAYIYSNGGQNRLREQDIRLMWLLPYSNQLACLAFTREPYDYPPNSDAMPVQITIGHCVSPTGTVGSTWSVAETHYRGDNPGEQYYRGFFHSPFSLYMRGSYNPVTGELARNERTRQYSWV